MNPDRREAVLALADTIADDLARQDVVAGYEACGYDDLADAAADAWMALDAVENVVHMETNAFFSDRFMVLESARLVVDACSLAPWFIRKMKENGGWS